MAILTRRFLINTTAAVTIALTQNGQTSTVNVPSWGTSAGQKSMTLSVTDSVSGTESYNYAPHHVSVTANPTGFPANSNSYGSYDALSDEIEYHHFMGDTGATFTVPGSLHTTFRNRNEGIDRTATHVYRAAGDYQWDVIAVDANGNWATASTTITVKADDFTAANTIVMDASGSFAGAPASNYQVTTFAAMKSALEGLLGSQSIVKVLGKYGDTYTNVDGLWHSACPNFIMDAWGTPANGNPVFTQTAASDASKVFTVYGNTAATKKLTVANWDFLNYWDSTEEIATNGYGMYQWDRTVLYVDTASYNNVVDILFDNVSIDGHGIGAYFVSSAGGRFTFHEVSNTNYKNYFVFQAVGDGINSMVGCHMKQPANALNGVENKDSYGQLRHCHNGWRTSASATYVISNNFVQPKHGWTYASGVNDQSAFRLNTSGTGDMKVYMNRNQIEGTISVDTYNAGMIPTHLYLNSNYIYSVNAQGGVCVGISCVGPIIKNNVFVIPDTIQGLGGGVCLLAIWDETHPANINDAPIRIYSNTFVDLRTNANTHGDYVGAVDIVAGLGMTPEIANNVFHAPNRTPAITSDGPLATTSMGFDASYPGTRIGFEKVSGTLAADVATSQSFTIPYASITSWTGGSVTQSDFSGAVARSAIVIGTTNLADNFNPCLAEYRGEISVSFDAGGIVVTNLDATTWTSGQGWVAHLDRSGSAMATDTRYAAQANTTYTYAVTPSSAAYQGVVSGPVSPVDIFGNARPGGGHYQASAGPASPGALLEVA